MVLFYVMGVVTRTGVTTITRFAQNCVMGSLVALYGYARQTVGIESSCTMCLVDIKVTRVGGVYCEGDTGFFFSA